MTQSTSIGKITTYPENPRVYKAQIAAKYAGVQVEVNTNFTMGVTNKSADFLAKYPLGKVPVMETKEGPIYESDAIAYYVAQHSQALVGASAYDKARVLQYVSFASAELGVNIGKWLYPLLGYFPYNKQEEAKAKENLDRSLGALDKELATKTFLVGERVTLADIACVCTLYSAMKLLLEAPARAKHANVLRWFETCVNQPNFKAVLGEFKFCVKTMEKVAPKKEEKPKKEAAKPAASASDDLEAAAEKEKAEEKKKNPLDELPKSSFVLDEWKRFYSNNETPDAIKWFWEKVDKEGYSLWKVDYKYNNELGLVFMSSNLIGGFFQRLEKARKYAFGSMVVCGEDKKNTISGYFVFRGQGVPAEVQDAADYPSYDFKKCDWNDAKVKAQFNDYLSWEGANLPGKFADGKIFK